MTRRRFTTVATVAAPDPRAPGTSRLDVLTTATFDDGSSWRRWDHDGEWEQLDPPVSKPPVTPGATAVKPRRRARR